MSNFPSETGFPSGTLRGNCARKPKLYTDSAGELPWLKDAAARSTHFLTFTRVQRTPISYHAGLRRRSGFTYTHSLTDAVLPGRTGFFVEAVCTEGVPPSLQTVGPFENWPGRQTTPEKTVRRTGAPVCGENAQTEAARTHRSWEVDFKSTASTAWQRVNIGCTRSQYSFSFSNGPFSQDTACGAQDDRRSRTRWDAHSNEGFTL